MTNWKQLAGGVAMAAISTCIVQQAEAQVTSSALRGQVTSPEGQAVSGATVVVTDTRTGSATNLTANSQGSFSARGLNVGGPYSITAKADGFQSLQLNDVFIALGETANLNLQFTSADSARVMETMVITASSASVIQTAIGPNSTFDLATLQNSPAVNRDLRDIIRQDPRVYIDESFGDGVQCAGANPRFNSLTVDGVSLNDGFGLNSNGYPGQQMPFPFDAISNVSVELAPFDVQYNGFTACNINAVTKSGTNEFHGSAFFDYTDDSLVGDKTEGDSITTTPFETKRHGFTIGGPILKDRLFFFGAYEKFEGPGATIDRGVEGSGAGTEIIGFSQADYDRIRDAAINIYDYDPGGVPATEATFNEKYLMRVDANITDNHRASFTYNYDEGLSLSESDGDDNEFEYSKHLYQRGAETKTYSGQLFSNWTDNFSTEFRVSKNEVDFTQASIDGAVFGEVQISHNGNTIYLGSDDSRHANDLNYDTWTFKGLANYQLNNHSLTLGAERVETNVFNLFVQEAEGEYRFNSIDDFIAGTPSRIIYENAAGTNNANDGGAEFGYAVNTVYLQDEWEIKAGMNITAGLRYDYYQSDDEPRRNQVFFDKYGFDNTSNLDGKDLLMPRLGFSYDAGDIQLRAGAGLYSGGNPNVWLSNNYSNNGVALFEAQDRSGAPLSSLTFVNDEDGLGRPFYGIPEGLFNQVAAASSNGPVNALDPSFEIPSEWKVAAGFTYNFDLPGFWGEDYTLMADWLLSASKDAATVQAISLEKEGNAPDGRPVYGGSAGFGGDYILTNDDGGKSNVLSGALSKSYDDVGVKWTLGYAYMDAEDSNPMTSSVANSNFFNVARTDANSLGVATSNYEIPHRFTLNVSWQKAFFGEYFTRANLFGSAYQARPYSYTFNSSSDDMFGDDSVANHLLYVPTGPDDQLVRFADGFDQAAFFAYVDGAGLERGGIAGRNDQDGQWVNKFDLRIEQEFPGALQGHKSKAYFTIENIGNMLNDEWGAVYQAGFPQTVGIVDASLDETTNQYVYNEFFAADAERRQTSISLWEMRVGVKYEF